MKKNIVFVQKSRKCGKEIEKNIIEINDKIASERASTRGRLIP